jgi:phosphoribosyl-AMP cyclohydrolase
MPNLPNLADKKFFEHVKTHCAEYGVDVVVTRGEQLNLGGGVGRCAGTFNGTSIRIAGAQNRFISVLVHEYAHFLQFIYGEEIWDRAIKNNVDAIFAKDCKYSRMKIKEIVEADRDLELDAEKKAVTLIKKWKLTVNLKNYIRGANAYIYFFNYLRKHRKWCKHSPSCENKILKIMNVTFDCDYDTLPEDYERLVNQYCV